MQNTSQITSVGAKPKAILKTLDRAMVSCVLHWPVQRVPDLDVLHAIADQQHEVHDGSQARRVRGVCLRPSNGISLNSIRNIAR